MKTKWISIVLTLLTAAAFIGCASTLPVKSFRSADLNDLVASGKYAQRIDTFIVLLDGSQSMGDNYPYTTKIEMARDFLGSMNQTIPDLKLKGGLDAFGTGSCLGGEKEVLVYGMTDYTAGGFAQAADKVKCVGGNTPLAYAIGSAGATLADAKGDMAMIIVSDGKRNNLDPEPEKAAAALKDQYGDRLCIYTVLIGNDPSGEAVLRKIADASGCGFFEKAENLADASAMADFVKKVFLKEAMDSDGDGVYDSLDQCPDTPRGVSVDSKGCPLDTDGDGVYDYQDKCPGTPAGVKVDADGCPYPKAPAKWVLEGAWFDFDKADIKPAWIGNLNEAIDLLKANPGMTLLIQGHTDNYGTAEYNQLLSTRRANVVKEYLVGKGVSADRLTASGFGFTMPVAPNDTKENRAKNRRVELIPKK